VIRLPPQESLTDIERYALGLLIDLARIPPVEDPSVDVVRLLVVERDGAAPDLRTCVARDWYLERGDGTVSLPRPVLRRIGEVATARTEWRSTSRDRYDRVPARENELVQAGLASDPVISRAAVALRTAVIATAGRRPLAFVAPWPDGRRWAAAFTHDLDVVAYWPLFTLLRIAELTRKGELRRIGRVALAAVSAIGRDPVARAVRGVLDDECAHGIVSTWFVLCGTPSFATMRAGDLTYRSEGRAAQAILDTLTERGSEIGLHGSFATADRDSSSESSEGDSNDWSAPRCGACGSISSACVPAPPPEAWPPRASATTRRADSSIATASAWESPTSCRCGTRLPSGPSGSTRPPFAGWIAR